MEKKTDKKAVRAVHPEQKPRKEEEKLCTKPFDPENARNEDEDTSCKNGEG